ncbi:MAG: STAS domain-containing protein [Fibromonadaceae bacterium]|jgi:anti-anti-sigma factor|nr:STAS domain-containing protein [Fibromonadaceae bacterium]
MMMECNIEDKGGYYQIVNFDFEAEDFHSIFAKIEEALKIKKQDMLLSLASIGVLYSSHLAIFVRIHQTLHRNNLNFIISDISPEIKNLLQITQLDSIFSIYKTEDDFRNSLKAQEERHNSISNFEWQIEKKNEDTANIICKGNMFTGKQLDELQKNILNFFNITFDFSDLQSMDSASIAFFDRITGKHAISVVGAKEELVNLFRENLIHEKMKFI